MNKEAIITIKEYDKLYVRENRDLSRNIISKNDAANLQSIILEKGPVFSFGNRCLSAQQYIGVIHIPGVTIEILPKIYGETQDNQIRNILIRMLQVTNQTSNLRQLEASVSLSRNSIVEIIIQSFLLELNTYLNAGLQKEYIKQSENLCKVKGQILFRKQFTKNILDPTRFYCRYSKYIVDNKINRFFKICLVTMSAISHDRQNKHWIDELLSLFENVSCVDINTALSFRIGFNSINNRAKVAYLYGRLFLENMHSTLHTGSTKVYTILFDMARLFESFVYRVARLVYGDRITFQKSGNYLISRVLDGKKFINLRPDITFRVSEDNLWVIDTKWKLPGNFAKESDIYQMNAYSSCIKNVNKTILLYPKTQRSDNLAGSYTIMSKDNSPRLLEIKFLDLQSCLNWKSFLQYFKSLIESSSLSTIT